MVVVGLGELPCKPAPHPRSPRIAAQQSPQRPSLLLLVGSSSSTRTIPTAAAAAAAAAVVAAHHAHSGALGKPSAVEQRFPGVDGRGIGCFAVEDARGHAHLAHPPRRQHRRGRVPQQGGVDGGEPVPRNVLRPGAGAQEARRQALVRLARRVVRVVHGHASYRTPLGYAQGPAYGTAPAPAVGRRAFSEQQRARSGRRYGSSPGGPEVRRR